MEFREHGGLPQAAGPANVKQRSAGMMHVVCAVEVGWRGMRECSTALGKLGAAVEVLIKGDVEPAVLGMITRRPGVAIRAVAARQFTWTLARRLLSVNGGGADTRLLIVNKSKTERWTSIIGRLRHWRVLRLEETEQGYRLFDAGGQEVPLTLLTPPPLSNGHGACAPCPPTAQRAVGAPPLAEAPKEVVG